MIGIIFLLEISKKYIGKSSFALYLMIYNIKINIYYYIYYYI